MGRPTHYSAELPVRCQALVDMLIGRVEEDSDPNNRWGGPLKTTFLLAMATPMLVLPIERIFKPLGQNRAFVADDVDLDPKLGERLSDILARGRHFAESPFYEPGTWTYLAGCDPFDVGRDWPRPLLEHLGSEAAQAAAAEASARDILLALRNALAHGGVTYLDGDGGHTLFATNMLGFASFADGGRKSLRLVRATVPGFERFLKLWAHWLETAGISHDMANRGPGYFSHAAE